jgi:3-carboxy-cis,cis-muconate cycloisomerase
MTLAEAVGKHEAHAGVAAACRRAVAEGRPLADVLAEAPAVGRHLDRARIDELLSPDNYLGVSREFIERALAGAEDDA